MLISKNHKQFLNDFSKEEIAEIFDSLKKVDKLLIKSLKAEGSNILINQGEIAGQRIPHFFINIIPRYNDDNINLDFPREKAEEKDLEKIASSIISEKSKEEDKKEKEKKKEFRDKTKKEIRKIHKSTPSRFAEFV
ncbi:hypothetical protein COX99_02180 [Candidatus Pacearchaeota archaeon CG_4_10_14_0_2_um_filter_31_10]|nr:MAG: hypothetical protein COX99_02180 [Candidatus Pacearchaeota archaeon CG_4_10_14_0_2_um_filter_31_10]